MAPPLDGVGAGALERVREQARIQVEGEDARPRSLELLPPERGSTTGSLVPDRGFLVLPEPQPDDLFLDLEGDPFALDDGVDYLFGILEPGCGGRTGGGRTRVPKFHAIWSRTTTAA